MANEYVEGDSVSGGSKISSKRWTNSDGDEVLSQHSALQFIDDSGDPVDVSETDPLPVFNRTTVKDMSNSFGYFHEQSIGGTATLVAFRYNPANPDHKAAFLSFAFSGNATDKPFVVGYVLNPTMSGSFSNVPDGSEMEVNVSGTASGGRIIGGAGGTWANLSGDAGYGLTQGDILAFEVLDIEGAGDIWSVFGWEEKLT